MFFKLTYIVKSLHFTKEMNTAHFTVPYKDGEIIVDMECVLSEGPKEGDRKPGYYCTARVEKKLSEKQMQLFVGMERDVPQGIDAVFNEVRTLLSDANLHAIRNLIWKRGMGDVHNPIYSGGGLLWSETGENWSGIRGDARFLDLKLGLPMAIWTSKQQESIQELLTEGFEEPLGHELFREAWQQRENAPRSSLMIGIAALETGFKEFASKVVPGATWLLGNVQSPPIVKMLNDYLPTLPVKLTVRGEVLPPPPGLIEQIKIGVTLRNEIAHGKKANLKADRLEEILRTICDILYLLDYYSGHSWASENIRPETAKQLIKNI